MSEGRHAAVSDEDIEARRDNPVDQALAHQLYEKDGQKGRENEEQDKGSPEKGDQPETCFQSIDHNLSLLKSPVGFIESMTIIGKKRLK